MIHEKPERLLTARGRARDFAVVVTGRIRKGLATMRALMQSAHTPKFEKAGRAMKAFEALHHDVVGPFWISFHFVSPSCIAAGTVNFGGVASFVGA